MKQSLTINELLEGTFSVTAYKATKTGNWKVNIHRLTLAERYAKATNKDGKCSCDKTVGREFKGKQYADQYAAELSKKFDIPVIDYAINRYFGEVTEAPKPTKRPKAEQPQPPMREKSVVRISPETGEKRTAKVFKTDIDVVNPTTGRTMRAKPTKGNNEISSTFAERVRELAIQKYEREMMDIIEREDKVARQIVEKRAMQLLGA